MIVVARFCIPYHLFSILLFCLIFLSGCENKEDSTTTTNAAPQKEIFVFQDSTAQNMMLEIKKHNDSIAISLTNPSYTTALRQDNIKLIAIFPQECQSCFSVIAHLNNLALRYKDSQIFILNQKAMSIKNHKDFLYSSLHIQQYTAAHTDTLRKFTDSLKRQLNIEIRDYNAPLFLLLDKENHIIKSYEGLTLEEIFDIDMALLLNPIHEESVATTNDDRI